MKTAGLAPRAAALIVDGLLTFFALGYLVATATGRTFHHKGSYGFHLTGRPGDLWIVLAWFYWVAFEHLWGTTPGKRLFGLRVVNRAETNPTWGQSAVRNLLRIVDMFPYVIPYVVGFIFAVSDQERRRLGDRAAGTRVVSS